MFVLMCSLCFSSCSSIDDSHLKSVGLIEYPDTNITHTIQEGETLWHISKIYNIEINDLIKQNKIQDCTTIVPGQTIIIPALKSHISQAQKITEHDNNTGFIWPINGEICEHFKDKTNGVTNKGIDIAFKSSQNILASREGEVIFIGDIAGYGKTLIIDHIDDLTTIYCGSSDIIVKKGQRVTQGMVIAKSGISPRKNQPTLHFEIRKKHKPQNPLFYLN